MKNQQTTTTQPNSRIGAMFCSLRSRNFALYFFGQILSFCGIWIQNIAMSWLVYDLTGSVIMLATVSFLNLIPSLLITPFAGVISDRYSRYKIIMTTQLLFMLQAFALAALTLSGIVEVWMILLLSLFNGVVIAFESPSRQAFYSRLVPREHMSNAIALNAVTINSTRFIGPTIGGILVALVGEGYCFLINGISYIAVIGALLLMTITTDEQRGNRKNIMADLKEGFLYIKERLHIRGTLLHGCMINFFFFPFLIVLPAFVKDTLGGDSEMLGFAMSSVGAGSLLAALYLASRKSIHGLGRVISLVGAVFGVALIIFSLFNIPLVAYLLCFFLGFTVIASIASVNTLLQNMVDDSKRGRVMSYFMMAQALNPIGGMLLGWLSKYITLPYSLLAYGIIGLAVVLYFERRRPLMRASILRSDSENSIDQSNNPF